MPALTTADRRVMQAGVTLQVRRLALDTGRENIAVVFAGSSALRPELFRSFSRVAIAAANRTIIATLMTSDDPGLVGPNELGLAEPAFRRLGQPAGTPIALSPIAPPESLDSVRRKIAGGTLATTEIEAIVRDITGYRYADIEIAAFLVGAASFISTDELLALTRAMADAGTRLRWQQPLIVVKHCIGGIPGNRTSMIVVPIVAAQRITDAEDLVACGHVAGWNH